jgi:four helix bundle protein
VSVRESGRFRNRLILAQGVTPLLSGMRDHRSLEAWKEARKVSLGALDASRDHWKPYAAALFGQFQRAALSVQLNIAEGYALGTRKSFANHLRIAYGSAIETQEILELATDKAILPESMAHDIIESCSRCQRLVLGLLKRYRRPP